MFFSKMSLLRSVIWLAQIVLVSTSTVSNNPQVELGYATYEGTALDNGINQYLGMRYAAPPVGVDRFKLAQSPSKEVGVVKADKFGPICYGVLDAVTEGTPLPQSEDCLFINVFAPANATNRQLPVMLWIQGGGFISLFNPDYNGTGLIEASGGDVIVVSFNYRVGTFGFLASEDLAREGNLNIGLQDQRAAIRWVSQHIGKFGGDPTRITLFGVSIGGGSVLMQSLAYGGNPPPEAAANWSAGIAGAVNMPSVYQVEDLQYQYDQLLNSTNCLDLSCLRSLSSDEIQAANIARPYPGQKNVPLFPFGPVVDGKFFTDIPSAMWTAGNFSKDKPIALGSGHTEGTIFTPQANTSTDIETFLRTQFPSLTSEDISAVEALYNDIPVACPGVTAHESPLYNKLAKMYGDIGYACPTLDMAANLSEAGIPVYLYRDDIVDPAEYSAGYIVPHTWELQAIWGPQYSTQYAALPNATSYQPDQANNGIVRPVQKYWTSFAMTSGDANRFKDPAAPVWSGFGAGGKRLRLRTNDTAMEDVMAWEYARCRAWSALARKTRI